LVPLGAEGKKEAVYLYGRKDLVPFHLERWDLAHRATDFEKWVNATDYYGVAYEHVRRWADRQTDGRDVQADKPRRTDRLLDRLQMDHYRLACEHASRQMDGQTDG
jgi:hypothetical protein